jgi:hypothetical protein
MKKEGSLQTKTAFQDHAAKAQMGATFQHFVDHGISHLVSGVQQTITFSLNP